MTAKLRRQRVSGFTLIELILVTVLLGIIASAGTSMFADSFRTARMVGEGLGSADQARYALERLAREIRQVNYDTLAETYSITSTLTSPTTSMVFTNSDSQTVTIGLSGGNLTLGYGSASVLCGNVSSFSISYLKLDNTSATSTTDVRFVDLQLNTTDATSGQATAQRMRIALRNG